jgi:hypothetical protein
MPRTRCTDIVRIRVCPIAIQKKKTDRNNDPKNNRTTQTVMVIPVMSGTFYLAGPETPRTAILAHQGGSRK